MNAHSDWLKDQAIEHTSFKAVIADDCEYTFSELDKYVDSAALTLRENKIICDQLVPVILGHKIEFIIVVFALWRIGAVPVPVSPQLTESEYKTLFESLSVNVAVVGNEVSYLKQYINCLSADYKMSPNCLPESLWGKSKNNLAIVMLTSGSTGASKAVMISFSSLFNSFLSISKFDDYDETDKFLASLPFHHIGGFSILIRSLLTGASLCIPRSTKHEDIIYFINKFNPSIISLVPTVLKRLVEIGLKPNTALRSLYVGGGPSNEKLTADAFELNYPIVKVYGSTETCAMVSAVRIKRIPHFNSSGYALPGNDITIDVSGMIDYNDYYLGEILIRSGSLFSGYLNDDKLTKEKLEEGWYHTGDYGYIDENGLLHVVMRREDLIVSGGENLNPVEIQNALNSIDGISESFVTGIDDEEWGQIAVAYIVTNSDIKDTEIKNELRKLIAPYKIPKNIIRVKSLPRNDLGKVNRQELVNLSLNDGMKGRS